MSAAPVWDEAAKAVWYEANEDPPATHVVRGSFDFEIGVVLPPWVGDGKAAVVCTVSVAAWKQEIEGGALGWDWVEKGHPAWDTLSATNMRCPSAKFHIIAADSEAAS